jgi:uncharacterized protein (DUF2147 family)
MRREDRKAGFAFTNAKDGIWDRSCGTFPKQDPSNWRCTECEGNQKDAPVLGLVFIKGMKRNGHRYEGGTILDPPDGDH